MTQEPIQEPTQRPAFLHESLIPQKQPACGAPEFTGQVLSLLDGQPKDEATVTEAFAGMDDMFDLIAAGLYSLASMLVGEGEESVQLVEKAIATADFSVCGDALQARRSSYASLSRAALELLERRAPGSLAAPRGLAPASTCIQDDDLDAGGLSSDEFAKLLAGPEKERVRVWLAGLPVEFRVVFALRAVAGFTSQEVASLLAQQGGAAASGWAASDVREVFRQALCSLASQAIQATAAR
jgi:DNA-directed RNA polymerase specialized sigma24 family protein